MNCALITWKTNRTLGRQDPLVYIQERIKIDAVFAVAPKMKSDFS